ncbi:hypothetical protein [Leeuwenhoekiella sp. NPDC079379]|uniref:hypothetical protein n=1 Tax=Leeuwenhoekiella sp. NPDC079379 TaxID=3364122 RepID=UPI0037C57D1C
MRILILTLSIVTLLASVFPCCLTDRFCDSEPVEICDDTPQNDQDSDHLPCSPFFSCGNCTGFIISPSYTISFIQDPIFTTRILSFKSLNTYNYKALSFKPPREGYTAISYFA